APGAELGHVADTGRGAALGRGRLEEIGRAVVGDPVTALGDVTVTGGRPADGRALRIRGAVALRPVQNSAASQTPAAARHSVEIGLKRSAGQSLASPSQLSATSQSPAAGRQT